MKDIKETEDNKILSNIVCITTSIVPEVIPLYILIIMVSQLRSFKRIFEGEISEKTSMVMTIDSDKKVLINQAPDSIKRTKSSQMR